MADLNVGGRSFRDLDSYNAAKQDFANIERIRDRIDLTDIEDVKRVIDNIENGRYKFQTLLGEDFLDELEDLIKELEKSPSKKNKNSYRNSAGKNGLKDNDNKTVLSKTVIKKSDSPTDFDDYDAQMQEEILKALRKAEIKRRIFIVVMALIAAASLGYLVFYGSQYAKNDKKINELADLVDDTATAEEYSITLNEEAKDKPKVLKKYEAVYQKNKKVVGWIKIDGTKIDYPVMQTVNNEYYLDHNFDQEYDKNGSIFLDKDCDAAFPNDNMIIYGHHMKSGKMFGNLNYYSKESFYKEHPYIQFDTIYEEGLYQVMYVFRSRIYNEDEIVFKYYKFIDATSEDEFYSNMEEMNAISLYDTDVRAQYGDKLITLSTCDSSENNGRFVVVAKKIR